MKKETLLLLLSFLIIIVGAIFKILVGQQISSVFFIIGLLGILVSAGLFLRNRNNRSDKKKN